MAKKDQRRANSKGEERRSGWKLEFEDRLVTPITLGKGKYIINIIWK